MNRTSRGSRREVAIALVMLGAVLPQLPGCRRGETGYGNDDKHASASGSGASLDGMQLASARRVALESAADALQRRDLERLKQLQIWVTQRAQVPLFAENDLVALDMAIACLSRSMTPVDARARIDALATGTLRASARVVCADEAP